MVESFYNGLLKVRFIFLPQSISNSKNHSELFTAVQILVRNAYGGGWFNMDRTHHQYICVKQFLTLYFLHELNSLQ